MMTIEVCLTLIGIAVACGWPDLTAKSFRRFENACVRLARRRTLAVVSVGLTAALLRLAILPLCPVPRPFVPDDFSFLLAADTFASGRLTNPTPAMWQCFESIHICMKPTYMSMYFPGYGLVLAAAKALTGEPWFGVLCTSALMCAALCWALQAWLPPGWALLGGVIAILRLGLFSCWINSYHTAGMMAALGGALCLGALPRFLRSSLPRYSLLLASGVAILALTRPYEGLLLCLPVAVVLVRWYLKKHASRQKLLRVSCVPLTVLLVTGVWMGYYNYRLFGSPWTLPYTVNRSTYAMAPYFIWQSPRVAPAYQHPVMRRFYYENELAALPQIHSIRGFAQQTLLKGARGVLFFSGIVLLPPLVMLPPVLLDRRTRFLLFCLAVLAVGMLLEIFLLAYYLAAFTAAFYILGLQAMRHLRVLNANGLRVGEGMVRVIVVLCVVLCGVRLLASPLHIDLPKWPASAWNFNWWGPGNFGSERAQIESNLRHTPGQQLAIVRYSADHNPLDEWVYNAADIDSSKVIWAREMTPDRTRALIQYYSVRQVWLVQPDADPPQLSPYPAIHPTQLASSPVPPDDRSGARYASRLGDAWKINSRN
jgi:hypothetical protein